MVSEGRKKRLEDNYARQVATILHTELKQPLPGVVTITGIELSGDMSQARARYTMLGDDDQRRQAAARLGKVASFVQREAAQRLRLRVTPQLRFEYDDASTRGARVLDLLAELDKEHGSHSGDSE